MPETLISSASNATAADILGIIAPIHLGGYLVAVNLKTLLKPLINATLADGRAQGHAEGHAEGQATAEAKYQDYLERLRQAGVQIPDDIPLDPPEGNGEPKTEQAEREH